MVIADAPPRRLAASKSVHVPRGTLHVFRCTDPDARFLAMFTPATRFDESPGAHEPPAQLAALTARHDGSYRNRYDWGSEERRL